MRFHRWDAVALGSQAAAVGITAVLYSELPERIATHFDVHGNANDWMRRPWGAWLLPVANVAVWAIVRFANRFAPLVKQRAVDDGLMALVAALSAFFLSGLHLSMLWVALTPGAVITRPLYALLAIFLIVLGLIMPRLRRNPVVGIRTAWALASDENWARTHRVAGYSMVLGGAVVGVCAAIGGAEASVFAFVALMISAIFPALYSFVIARRTAS